MPLYQYVCQGCKAEREILVRGAEKPACPECGSTKLVQQASAFNTAIGGKQKAAPACGMSGCCPNAGACGLN